MEVKSRQILDVLAELGLGAGKTHSSSLESDEADKVRAQFERGSRAAGHGSASSGRAQQTIAPKIDLSHISKPGDVLKAILAKKKEEEEEARHPHVPAKAAEASQTAAAPPAVTVAKPAASAPPAPPAPRKIVPQPRSAPNIVPQPTTPAIASRPPSGPIVAKAPAGAVTRPVVVVAPPPGTVVVKPPVAAAPPAAPVADKPVIAVKPPTAPPVATALPPAPVAEAPTEVATVAPVEPIVAPVAPAPGAPRPTPPSTPSRRKPQRLKLRRPSRPRLPHRQFAAWSCRRPVRALFTRRPFCRPPSPAQATWPPAPDCSAEGPSSTAVLLALQVATRRALQGVALLQLPASSLADRAPNILPARPWAVPAPPAPPERVPALVLVLVLADHPVPASVHVPAAQAELLPLARLPVRSVLLRVDAAAGPSTPRPKKAR